MSFFHAKRQFEDNLNLYWDPNVNPEKYNLYAGLLNLADGLYKLEARVEQIEQKIKRM